MIVADRLAGEVRVEVEVFAAGCLVANVWAVRPVQIDDEVLAIGQHVFAEDGEDILRFDSGVRAWSLILCHETSCLGERRCSIEGDRSVRDVEFEASDLHALPGLPAAQGDRIISGVQGERKRELTAGLVGGQRARCPARG